MFVCQSIVYLWILFWIITDIVLCTSVFECDVCVTIKLSWFKKKWVKSWYQRLRPLTPVSDEESLEHIITKSNRTAVDSPHFLFVSRHSNKPFLRYGQRNIRKQLQNTSEILIIISVKKVSTRIPPKFDQMRTMTGEIQLPTSCVIGIWFPFNHADKQLLMQPSPWVMIMPHGLHQDHSLHLFKPEFSLPKYIKFVTDGFGVRSKGCYCGSGRGPATETN